LDFHRLGEAFVIRRMVGECEADLQDSPHLEDSQVCNLFWPLEARRLRRAHGGAPEEKPDGERASQRQGTTEREMGRMNGEGGRIDGGKARVSAGLGAGVPTHRIYRLRS
jgi:hypothetical protein